MDVLAAVREATSIRSAVDNEGGAVSDRGAPVFVSNQVERITFHDFATYELAFDPWVSRDPRTDAPQDEPTLSTPPQAIAPPPPSYLPADLADLDGLTQLSEAAIAYFLDTEVREALQEGVAFNPEPIIALIYRLRYRSGLELNLHYQPLQVPARVDALLLYFIEHFLADLLPSFEQMNPAQRADFFTRFFDPAVRDWVIRSRDMEMPWTLSLRTMPEWLNGGYIVGEAYGRIPKTFYPQNVGGTPVVTITEWLKNPSGRELLAYEYAWDHARTSSSFAAFSSPVDRSRIGTSNYFVASYHYDPVTRKYLTQSTVLEGALAVLGGSAPPGPTDAAARAAVDPSGNLGGAPPTGSRAALSPSQLYGFEPYPVNSINFGIRVVYRQAWHPRGIQPGELVRTVPLAPGQKEKVSIKILQRNKFTREMEDKSSTETTQESTTTTKDSSEIVEEAARASKWHLDASAKGSFNIGIVSGEASTDTGYAHDSSDTSRDTKSRLSETMQKTARTSRRENRVQVSTEHEETFESERSSEIINPNQEIAVTCLYETVQQIYTVQTALEGIEPVVFVAERVPRPDELNINWIRRHDWILSRALLDDSFRETLSLVSSQDPAFAATLTAASLGLDEVTRLSHVLTQAETSLATIHLLPGDIANTYEATLNAYQAAVARARANLEQANQLSRRIERLVDHFADNILHYCRAIWSAEDPDRRRMRYASLRVPTYFLASMDTQNVEVDPLTGQSIYTGAWEADPASWRSLSDVIHPAGPIAYAGNYAVYRLRYTEATAGISRVTRLAQQAYSEPVPPAVLVSPAARAAALHITVSVVDENFYSGDVYVLRISNPPPPPPPAPPVGGGPLAGGGPAVVLAELQVTLLRRGFNETFTDLTAVLPGQGRILAQQVLAQRLNFDGLLVTLAGGLAAGDEITLLPRPSTLVDPEIKYRRMLDPQASLAQLQQQIAAENTEDIVVDTNNLWLNLVKGTGTALEDFKLEHRRIDVESARAELVRRYLRLDQNLLADPDIEKKVVIHGPGHAARAAENEAVADDPPPPAPAPIPAPP